MTWYGFLAAYWLLWATTMPGPIPPWYLASAALICTVAAGANSWFDGCEKRIEREWAQHYRDRRAAEHLQKRLAFQARVTVNLPTDEQWARDVERILGIDTDDERCN